MATSLFETGHALPSRSACKTQPREKRALVLYLPGDEYSTKGQKLPSRKAMRKANIHKIDYKGMPFTHLFQGTHVTTRYRGRPPKDAGGSDSKQNPPKKDQGKSTIDKDVVRRNESEQRLDEQGNGAPSSPPPPPNGGLESKKRKLGRTLSKAYSWTAPFPIVYEKNVRAAKRTKISREKENKEPELIEGVVPGAVAGQRTEPVDTAEEDDTIEPMPGRFNIFDETVIPGGRVTKSGRFFA